MNTVRLFLCLCLLSLVALNIHGQTIKLDPGNQKYYLEDDGIRYTKSLYDTIIKGYDTWSTFITKTEEGYGLLYTGGKKPIELLPNEYEHIQHLYFEGYFVKKNGKYAQYQAMDNLDIDDNYKPYFLTKTPKFRTAFEYDRAKVMTLKARLYHTYGDEWKTWYYGVVWQGDRASVIDFSMSSDAISSKSFTCNDAELINIDTKPFFKIKSGNKYGIVDEQFDVQLQPLYDSITYLRTIRNISDYDDRKITEDYLILHQADKMYLANFTRGSNYVNYNFRIESYQVADGMLSFTENGKSMKMQEGNKVSSAYEIFISDKYGNHIIKKDKLYGVLDGERLVLEPIYADFELATWCGWDEDVYFFRTEMGKGNFKVFSARDKKIIHRTEQISDVHCTSKGVYVKRADAQWYALVGERFSYFGKPEIGYDSVASLEYPSPGILGYKGNRIHYYSDAATYTEISLPPGATNVAYIPETHGFVYKVNGKYGYNNQTTSFAPALEDLNIGYDKKEGSTLFSTYVNGKEYLFYPVDFEQDQSIRSFVDCQECYGYGFFLAEESETSTIKGSTTTRSERVFLWRDGEYERITTTVEPDREVTTTYAVQEPCPACSGTGKKRVWLRNSGGTVVVR